MSTPRRLDTALVQFELRTNGMVFSYHNFKVGDQYLTHGLYVLPVSKMAAGSSTGEAHRYLPSLGVRGKTYSDLYYGRFAGLDRDEYWLTEKEGIIKMHLRHSAENSLDRVYELDSCRIIR